MTSAERDAVFVHLRELFIMEDEEGQEYFFRFYDPRVVRNCFPVWEPDEIDLLFGPIRQFICEGSDPNTVIICGPTTDGMRLDESPLFVRTPSTPEE